MKSMKIIISRVDHRAPQPKARDSHKHFGATGSTDLCSRDICAYYVDTWVHCLLGRLSSSVVLRNRIEVRIVRLHWLKSGGGGEGGSFVSEDLSHSRMTCQAGSDSGDESLTCRRHLLQHDNRFLCFDFVGKFRCQSSPNLFNLTEASPSQVTEVP